MRHQLSLPTATKWKKRGKKRRLGSPDKHPAHPAKSPSYQARSHHCDSAVLRIYQLPKPLSRWAAAVARNPTRRMCHIGRSGNEPGQL